MKFKLYTFLLLLGFGTSGYGQQTWKNPLNETFNAIQGQVPQVGSGFQRLPNNLKEAVREPVWTLAQHTAGEYIEFTSNATKIIVQFHVNGPFAMPHMPNTGVSGVDLFAYNEKNIWDWMPGTYSFKDTVTYTFDHIATKRGNIFRLYLPLYNSIKWLEVGVDQNSSLNFLPASKAKPIVIYGTSITQGGCASRPGLAWTSILGRGLGIPVINLGFSSNGRLETPIINLMGAVEAKLFILDCIPNLGSRKLYPEEEMRKRITDAIINLQQKQKNTPILLSAHSGGNTDHILDTLKNIEFRSSSAILTKIYTELKAKGIKNIYLLTTKEIGMSINSTVDGSHPNDIGMMENALAFEKAYRKIFR